MAVPSRALQKLVDRYDPTVVDLPRGQARVRLVVTGKGSWDAVLDRESAALEAVTSRTGPGATLTADEPTWQRIARNYRGGLQAFRAGRLTVRNNLHLGVAFLAATSGSGEKNRLEFRSVRTAVGRLSTLQAGTGTPVVMVHGLGGTKASFLPTVDALADSYRTIALDLPGFGDSDKPIAAPYDARYFARSVVALLDVLEIDRAHVIGNSMGGRVALELGLSHPNRVRRLVLLSSSLAWLRERRWAPLLRFVRPELGLLQFTPRSIVEGLVRNAVPGAETGWTAAGVDEFLRAYFTPRGRAAFYAAARNIYLEEPRGKNGFWTRLAGLTTPSLFIWGRHDNLVPLAFSRYVSETLPNAEHLELNCGHVPQLERPRETHDAIDAFLARDRGARRRTAARAA